jgi:ADP-ribose pyrophosphatase
MSVKIINSRTVFNGKFTRVDELELETGNDKHLYYECVDRGHAVAAIVYDPSSEEYLFVRQFRVGAKKELTEIVAGLLDKKDEQPETAIAREIEEELGCRVRDGSLGHICSFYTSPGGLAELMHLYYAEAGEKINDGGGIDDEQISIIRYKREQHQDISQFEDAKTIIAVQYVMKNNAAK